MITDRSSVFRREDASTGLDRLRAVMIEHRDLTGCKVVADLSGKSEDTVSRAATKAEAEGWLQVIKERGKPTRYIYLDHMHAPTARADQPHDYLQTNRMTIRMLDGPETGAESSVTTPTADQPHVVVVVGGSDVESDTSTASTGAVTAGPTAPGQTEDELILMNFEDDDLLAGLLVSKPEPVEPTAPRSSKYAPNLYSGPCSNCGVNIASGEGSRIKDKGKWKVFHGNGREDCPDVPNPIGPGHAASLTEGTAHDRDGQWGPEWSGEAEPFEYVPARETLYRYYSPERYADARLEDFDPDVADAIRSHIDRGGATIVFHGPTGTGKTRAAHAAARAYLTRSTCPRGEPGLLARDLATLLAEAREQFGSDDAVVPVREAAVNAAVLVLDDIGVERLSDWAREFLAAVVNGRYVAERPTIITTNANLAEFRDHLGPRIADRLTERSTTIPMTGANRRRDTIRVPESMRNASTVPTQPLTPHSYFNWSARVRANDDTERDRDVLLDRYGRYPTALVLSDVEAYAKVLRRLNAGLVEDRRVTQVSESLDRKRRSIAGAMYIEGFESVRDWFDDYLARLSYPARGALTAEENTVRIHAECRARYDEAIATADSDIRYTPVEVTASPAS